MKPEEVILIGKYKEDEENYMRKRMAEYFTEFPNRKESDSENYHSRIDYEDRCKKINDKINRNMTVISETKETKK